MSLLDLLLNLTALLLWFGWRAVGIDRVATPTALSLAATLRQADTRPPRSWPLLAAVIGLLVLRSTVYWRLGPALDWAPDLQLGLISIGFRVDLWPHALAYSIASFLHVWVIAHVGLLLIVLLNRNAPEAGSFQPFLNAQWGFFARWPAAVLVPLVVAGGAGLWLCLHWPLLWLELTTPPPPGLPPWQQATAFGLNLLLVWEYFALGLLAIHVVNTYVYLGSWSLWTCLAQAGRNLCRWLPLHLGRIDFAPFLITALIIPASYGAAIGIQFLFSHRLF